MNILHLTNTTLAGAPGMLSDALNRFTQHSSALIQFNDKGPGRNLFQPSAIYLGMGVEDIRILQSMIERSDVIHVHNLVPKFVLAELAKVDISAKKTVYQIHSPSYEPPIYGDLSVDMGIAFDEKLVLGHYHPRQHASFEIVPNCLYRQTMYLDLPRPNDGITRILFSPSSAKKGRWGAKSNAAVDEQLNALRHIDTIELTQARDMAPETLMLRRKTTDITIDEVLTGAFHLVSYEGLACGNVVVNGCDDLTEIFFKAAFQTNESPPFLRSAPDRLLTDLIDVCNDTAELKRLQTEGHDFFWDVMAPEKVVQIYCNIYERSREAVKCTA